MSHEIRRRRCSQPLERSQRAGAETAFGSERSRILFAHVSWLRIGALKMRLLRREATADAATGRDLLHSCRVSHEGHRVPVSDRSRRAITSGGAGRKGAEDE